MQIGQRGTRIVSEPVSSFNKIPDFAPTSLPLISTESVPTRTTPTHQRFQTRYRIPVQSAFENRSR